MTGSIKQIEWAKKIIAGVESQIKTVVTNFSTREEKHGECVGAAHKADMIGKSLLQDLRNAKSASDVINQSKNGIAIEPMIINCLKAWTPETEAKLTAKLGKA